MLADLGLRHAHAVLFDLGVSSMQLDVRERGFAYAEDAPLDMRMDGGVGLTAADVLNTYGVGDLTRVLREYGEEKFARRIAQHVVDARRTEPFTRSARLVDLVRDAIPAPARRTGGHPAKRTFQALRIEVNDELAVLRRAVPGAIDALAVGGRLVAMSYHSLEDRIVKRAFTAVTQLDVPPDMPVVPDEARPRLRLVTRGAEKASRVRDRREPPRRVRAAARRRARPARPTSPAPEGRRGMSSPLPSARVQPSSARGRDHPGSTRVAPRRRVPAPRVPFVVLVVAVLIGGIGGLLMFNTSMQQASFTASALEARAVLAGGPAADAADAHRGPARPAAGRPRPGPRAWCRPDPGFLRLPDGKVLGDPTPATSLDALRIEPLPATKPADLVGKITWVKAGSSSAPSDGSATSAGRREEP